ncbi:hypothetical protein [Brachybacterium subflavum]|uniref:hypothetical protein n=1 Tax=Brachybacterium subflavum TaxID=2585206 RepID=UPI0012663EEB|nr:hypothetical protein [Brachybacterium subflavum]
MSEALASLADMSPIGAVVVILGVVASVLVQVAKRAHWSKSTTQLVAVGIATVLGIVAVIVSGVVVGIPGGLTDKVSVAVVIVAAVAVASRAAYAIIGQAIPDGTDGDDHDETHRADG